MSYASSFAYKRVYESLRLAVGLCPCSELRTVPCDGFGLRQACCGAFTCSNFRESRNLFGALQRVRLGTWGEHDVSSAATQRPRRTVDGAAHTARTLRLLLRRGATKEEPFASGDGLTSRRVNLALGRSHHRPE